MKTIRRIRTFTDRYPLVGPFIWMLSIQYFVIQVVVALAWPTNYSIAVNPISDLGNTMCGIFNGRPVCSPLHDLMNASFILLGITMAIGSVLIYQEFKKSFSSLVGFSFMGIGGVGALLVGLFPENTISALHIAGATLPFFIGNVSLVILSFALTIPRPLRIYTFFSGIISLVALVFLVTQHDFGIGTGGIERIVAYPQTFWLIVFGVYMSRDRIMKRRAVPTSVHKD